LWQGLRFHWRCSKAKWLAWLTLSLALQQSGVIDISIFNNNSTDERENTAFETEDSEFVLCFKQ
jgi:hypothetical protein